MNSDEDQPRRARGMRRRAGRVRVRSAVALFGAGAIVSVAGCGSSSDKTSTGSTPATSSTSTSAATTSTPTGSTSGTSSAPSPTSTLAAKATQDALSAYRAAYADWVAAAATSNYQDPALAHHMSGQALSYVTGAMYVNKTKGAVSKGAPALNPTIGQLVPAANPTQVVVNDHMNDANWLLYTTDGHLFNDVPGGCHQTQALVVEKDGVWKVDQFAINKVGTC
ncbi:transcription elongation factor [Catenulispora sp. GAS73]|uniref:hypothetical protein n=1 Tax=Catenulispora sp. GAS73 TaxID=3156269 RepID=UPI0035197E43